MGRMAEDTPSNVVPIRSDEDELVALEERVMDGLEEADRADAAAGETQEPVGLSSYRRRGRRPQPSP